ncbi:hypothetical protein KGF86_09665 [Ornithinibacillus massiliensis]|uniref:Bacterial spore germination immunoglobulin-like domain-containing protein n=1 Tax=Ornithinibacillus massiliensis TaxID=1944633 RepID=A0ABS5MDS5_9BACI|nr:hypothetical protein [Ornithinibacillus massiliensis]MBS3680481.1 hypothetical protein [Ornithinibacillus massiliensis]
MKKAFMIISTVFILSSCGNQPDKASDPITETTHEVYANFQNVDIQIENNQAIITGNVNASNDEFYFQVEQEDHILKEEEKVTVDGEWSDFSFRIEIIDEMKEQDEVVIVKMYTKGEDGKIVNPNYIPLDLKEKQYNS